MERAGRPPHPLFRRALKATFIALVCTALLLLTSALKAQTFTTLHSFAGYPSDGAEPQAGLVLSGNTLYGTAPEGGSANGGTVFAVNTDGTGFTTLNNFTALRGPFPGTNSDGAYPRGGLILSGSTLYGTTSGGTSSSLGDGVQSFVHAATDNRSLRDKRHFDVAEQLHRVHFAIRVSHQRHLHQRLRRDESLHQCHHRVGRHPRLPDANHFLLVQAKRRRLGCEG